MAKRKVKSSKKKKQARPAARAPRTATGKPIRFAMEACSISNPFCPEAVAARWPDNSFTKSSGYSLTGTHAELASDANGNGATLFLPTGQRAAGTVTGVTGAFAALTDFALPSNIVRWRVTSYGLRISSPLSKMTATGNLLIRLVSPMNGSTLQSVDTTSIRADSIMDVPISRLIDEDVFVLPMPLGDNARWFNAGTPNDENTIANWVNPGWQVPLITIRGAPASTQTLRVLCYYNFEFVFADGASETYFATAPPPDQPAVRSANSGLLSSIGNFFEGTAEKLDSIFRSKALNLGVRMIGAGATRNPALLLANNVD